MQNSLNLIFGPRLPDEFEHVGLSFIAAPTMRPDFAIAALSAERYAPENYAHIDESLTIFSEGFREGILQVDLNYPDVTFGNRFATPVRSAGRSGSVILTGSSWNLRTLNTPIAVKGVSITKAQTWYPNIKPGVVSRLYTVTANEPASSWLRVSGLNTGDTVVAIYAVPEVAYTSTSSSVGVAFPPNPSQFKTVKEICSPTNPFKFSYLGDIYEITEVLVNGSTQYSGDLSWKLGDAPSYIKNVNVKLREIEVSQPIHPDDHIEIKYKTYNQYYTYSGFVDRLGTWYPFDANPEYGHYIGDDRTGTLRNSSQCLTDQATIYAIPTAYIKYSFTPSLAVSGVSIGSLSLDFIRGVDWGETHFIRHIIGDERNERISIRHGATSVGSWGEAVFARNYYDENGTYDTDVYSDALPSMIPLGRFVLTAPAAMASVSIADIRQRGGGVPIDFPMIAIETEDGLDKLRGFYDLGIWEGKAVKDGGVVEVRIDSSLLKTDENDTDPNTFLASEIYEIVKSQMMPGIDFEIVYSDDVS